MIRLDDGEPVVAHGLAGVSGMDRSGIWPSLGLEDVPDILRGMTEFTACNAGTEVKLANSDAIVLDVVREIVVALGHGTNEDCNALALVEASDIIADTYDL
jgi:hypothetical protein